MKPQLCEIQCKHFKTKEHFRLQLPSDWHRIYMVFSPKHRWYRFDTVPDPANQFHNLIIFPPDGLLCVRQCSKRKNEYRCAGLDLHIAFFLMRTILAAASRKGDPDGIGLPDIGTAFRGMSFRTFCYRMSIFGKYECEVVGKP